MKLGRMVSNILEVVRLSHCCLLFAQFLRFDIMFVTCDFFSLTEDPNAYANEDVDINGDVDKYCR